MTLPGMGRPSIRVHACARTHAGRRRTQNQDRFLIADLTDTHGGATLAEGGDGVGDAAGPLDFEVGPRGGVLLVADGMGGAAAGGLASSLAARSIYGLLSRGWSPGRNPAPRQFAGQLVHAVEEASRLIWGEAQEDGALQGMGTTATVAGVLDGFLYLAQVGDSRGYLIRNGAAVQLTRDQSVVQSMMDAGTLTEEEAEASPVGNLILQALGTKPDVEVDLTYQEIRRGDLLLLCSDGLSGQVKRDEIAEVVAGAGGLEDACRELVDLANDRGGPDNVTVVLARMEGQGLEEPQPGDVVERVRWEI